jgi:hypothetical protein
MLIVRGFKIAAICAALALSGCQTSSFDGIDTADLHFTMPPARIETEVALAIQDGKADVGFGIAAVARQCRLDFVPLQRERYDIAIGRRDYFEPPFQRLLTFARTVPFGEKALV